MTRARRASRQQRNANGLAVNRRCRALTLMELAAVLAAGTLLLGAAAQGLRAARSATRDEVCLANLKDLGVAVRTFAAENNDRLPGPLYPAVSRYQTPEGYERWSPSSPSTAASLLNRRLTWLLREYEDMERLAFCPTMGGIVPDRHFVEFGIANSRLVMPTHYVLNHYGTYSSDGSPSGFVGNARVTNPPYYFGFAPYLGAPQTVIDEARKNPPRHIGEIPKAAREWMIADAWYRGKAMPAFLPQQEGPYQSAWSGEALPFFAPHDYRGSAEVPVNSSERASAAARTSQSKGDGFTNTLFFDGHVAPVPSRSGFYVTSAGSASPDLLYGFPGTVNGTLPPPSVGGRIVWR